MDQQEVQDQAQEALQQVKDVYESGEADINGRKYVFVKMKHRQRRKVFAFFSRVQQDIKAQSFWWLESPEWETVEEVISKHVMFEDSALNKLDDHWDQYPQDYLIFVCTALGAISYPFMAAVHTS